VDCGFSPIFLLHCAGAFVSSALQLELCLEWAALVAKKAEKSPTAAAVEAEAKTETELK